MEPSTRSTNAAPGESTVTLSIKRTENLLRLFRVDTLCDVVRELPTSDPRREDLLRYFTLEREHLSRLVNFPEAAQDLDPPTAPLVVLTR